MNTMHSRTTTTLPGFAKHGTGRLILTTVGAAVLLGALVTVGLRAYTSSDGPSTTVSPPVEPKATVSAPSRTIFVVTSEEHAAAVWAGINEASQISGMTGGPLILSSVIVLPADVPMVEMLLPGAADVVDLRNAQ